MTEQGDEETYDFDVGEFLQKKILSKIGKIKVLMFGNTSQTEAIDFLKNEIATKFQID